MQDYFFVRSDGKYVKLNFREIIYVEALKNYLRIVTSSSAKPYMVLISMKQLEQSLPKDEFCRVHRSYIVSLHHITAFDHEQITMGDINLPISEQYKNNMLQKVTVVISEVRCNKPVKAGIEFSYNSN